MALSAHRTGQAQQAGMARGGLYAPAGPGRVPPARVWRQSHGGEALCAFRAGMAKEKAARRLLFSFIQGQISRSMVF